MTPGVLHVFESRREAFSEQEVLQENLIIRACRDGVPGGRETARVKIRSSNGAADLRKASEFTVPLGKLMDVSHLGAPLRIPSSEDSEAVCEFLADWPESVESLGYRVSTGPVVPFRARQFISQQDDKRAVPFLWMQHVTPMQVIWPIPGLGKPQFFLSCGRSRKLLLGCRNYVLVRRFSAKEEASRITAAPLIGWDTFHDLVALENHLNYITSDHEALSGDEAIGLASVLNSSLLDVWFRAVNGNTQVSAAELRSMPMPHRDRIVEIGAAVRGNTERSQTSLITEGVLGVPQAIRRLAQHSEERHDQAR
jgi:adenine-specific DNA-methyltransferase